MIEEQDDRPRARPFEAQLEFEVAATAAKSHIKLDGQEMRWVQKAVITVEALRITTVELHVMLGAPKRAGVNVIRGRFIVEDSEEAELMRHWADEAAQAPPKADNSTSEVGRLE